MIFLLHQRGLGRTQRISTQSWDSKNYLWHFLRKALAEEVNWPNINPSLEKYCDLKGYKNPTHGSLEYLEFFIALALDVWKERLEAKSK